MRAVIAIIGLILSSLIVLNFYNKSNTSYTGIVSQNPRNFYPNGRLPSVIESEESTGLWFSKETKDSMTDEKTIWITLESSGHNGSDNRYHEASLNVICNSNGGEGVFLSSQEDLYTSPQVYAVAYRFDEQTAVYESWSGENKNTWPMDTHNFISQIQVSKLLQIEVETISARIRYKFDLAGFKKTKKNLDNKCRQFLTRQN